MSRFDRAPAGLGAVESFRETLSIARQRMEDQIALKLDSFFEMSEYQWTATYVSSPQLGEHPSTYLIEMVNYLTLVVGSVLVNLSEEFKAQIYRSALQHCADRLMVRANSLTYRGILSQNHL